MRIVIDLQAAQSSNAKTGTGRHALSLTKSILRNRGEHDIVIVLNSQFPESTRRLCRELADMLPRDSIRVWDSLPMTRESNTQNEWRRQSAELIREAFFDSLEPDILLLSNLFEGYGDEAVTSLGQSAKRYPTAVVVYDIVPDILQDSYFDSTMHRDFYVRKYQQLAFADLILGASECITNAVLETLRLDSDRAISILFGADSDFRETKPSRDEDRLIRNRLGIGGKFLFYHGLGEEKDNLGRLIHAYATLDQELRQSHQLLLAGPFSAKQTATIRGTAQSFGLKEQDIVVFRNPEKPELLALYNLCDLFVFPSVWESLGTPLLEAILCGAPAIASNTGGLPELVGVKEALFDPYSHSDITEKIERALFDPTFREHLVSQGRIHSKEYSWDECARRAMQAFMNIAGKQTSTATFFPRSRKKLAFLSPLPPARSGIADYSQELLPELARFYDIVAIVPQRSIKDCCATDICEIHDNDWFWTNAGKFDRVLYHIGNSPSHTYIFELLRYFPGVVVLHDFFLNDLVHYMDSNGDMPGLLPNAVYESHGYPALRCCPNSFEGIDRLAVYPCNFSVLSQALGVLVHSEYSKRLARAWYTGLSLRNWRRVPFLRASVTRISRAEARRRLGFDDDDFVVCSFGFITMPKLSHRLLDAWTESALFRDNNCRLVFVGDTPHGLYSRRLRSAMKRFEPRDKIKITGWLDSDLYRCYLAAADAAVQLRWQTRGETSAALYDCLAQGLPTIVNAHGSMAELQENIVFTLREDFSDQELAAQLEKLWKERKEAAAIGANAREHVMRNHSPSHCAQIYYDAIESIYENEPQRTRSLIGAIADLQDSKTQDLSQIATVAQSIASNFPADRPEKQLLVDISAIIKADVRTGIERVTRGILNHLLTSPPPGYRVEPVYATVGGKGYLYAKVFTSELLGCPQDSWLDEPIETLSGDVFLGLDFNANVTIAQSDFLSALSIRGVKVHFVVYDLLPILLPHRFPNGMGPLHEKWLQTITQFQGAACISRTVAVELAKWVKIHAPENESAFKIEWFHLGSDLENTFSTHGNPEGSRRMLKQLSLRPTFLMVGTVEPRKGHLLVLRAFESIWREGIDANLVIVGQEGWKDVPEEERGSIILTVKALNSCKKRGKKLFWLKTVSDEFLEEMYSSSTCLVAASEGEGFGLPLIEAARHGLAIIARDIPVFHEVAGNYPTYFENKEAPEPLVECLRKWISTSQVSRETNKGLIPFLTWEESAAQLVSRIVG
jgi:glycosyltransferase involved in cell wall biosynthesis